MDIERHAILCEFSKYLRNCRLASASEAKLTLLKIDSNDHIGSVINVHTMKIIETDCIILAVEVFDDSKSVSAERDFAKLGGDHTFADISSCFGQSWSG